MRVNDIIKTLETRIKSSDIASRMASGAFWSFTGTATAKGILMIAGILCARILGKELYGQYGLVKTALSTFMVLGGTGLGITATKYISEYRENFKEKIPPVYFVTNGFAAMMAVVMLVALFFFSDFLAVRLLHTPTLAYTLRLASITLIFIVVNVAQEGVLAGFEDFKGKAIAMFLGSLFQAPLLLFFAWKWGLNGAIM